MKDIKLNLGLGNGDVVIFLFDSIDELLIYINEVFISYEGKVVWLYTSGGERGEIVITENGSTIIQLISYGAVDGRTVHLHEYPTYEDAYKVALDMREGHPKCYNE